MRPIEQVRADLYARLVELPEEDVRTLAVIAAELPLARLVAACEAEADRGIEGPDKPVRTGPTTLRVQSLAELLGTLRTWRRYLGLPAPLPRGSDGALLAARRAARAAVIADLEQLGGCDRAVARLRELGGARG